MIKRALIVGVDNYQDVEINPLKYAVEDAVKLSGLFESALRFDQVQHLRDPGKEQLMEMACKMVEGLGPGDLFVFFFAGHGTVYQDKHLLLCPKANHSNLEYFDDAVPVKQLKDKTGNTAASRLFILDACRNNLFAGRSVGSSGLSGVSDLRDIGAAPIGQGALAQADFSLLCACDEGEQARELPSEGQGLFSLAFRQLVLDNTGKGVIKLNDEFVSDLRKRMVKLGTQHGFSKHQSPWIKHNGEPPLLSELAAVDSVEDLADQEALEQTLKPATNIKVERAVAQKEVWEKPISAPRPGESWVEPCTDMEFVWVPPGAYMMGENHFSFLKPVHKVELSGFWMGKYTVTQEQWKKLMDMNPSRFKNRDRPVEHVSWDDTQVFIQKLNQKIQAVAQVSLPSEAQWEYAARSGGKNESDAGVDTNKIANEWAEIGWFDSNTREQKTQPVGMKKPNGLGLYDMSGNVWEWCQDLWHDDYIDAPSDGSAWLVGDICLHVKRGVSYGNGPGGTTTYRGSGHLVNGRCCGFRLVIPCPTAKFEKAHENEIFGEIKFGEKLTKEEKAEKKKKHDTQMNIRWMLGGAVLSVVWIAFSYLARWLGFVN